MPCQNMKTINSCGPCFFLTNFCRRLGTANIVNGLFLPFSSVTHNFSATISLKKEITRTTTSVSLSMTRILLCHCNIGFADQIPHGEREYSYWIMSLSAHGFLTDIKQPKAITRQSRETGVWQCFLSDRSFKELEQLRTSTLQHSKQDQTALLPNRWDCPGPSHNIW